MQCFEYHGGVELLVNLHKEILVLLGCKVHEPLFSFAEYHQQLCCTMLTLLSKDSMIRDRVTASGGLETCIQSFVRSVGPSKVDALYALCNISDLPKNQEYFSHHPDIIDQITYMIVHLETYSNMTAIIAISLFLNVSECKDSHAHLFKPATMEKMMTTIWKRCHSAIPSEESTVKMLKYYLALLQAQIIAGSKHLILEFPQDVLVDILQLMKEVTLFNSDYIRSFEIDHGTEWDSFLFLFYLYEPEVYFSSQVSAPTVAELSLVAVQVLLLMLQSSIWKKNHVLVLEEQNLLEYLIILPWHVPSQLKNDARTVVRDVIRLHERIQPPSLSFSL